MIEKYKNIHKYDLALEKYWVTQSGYFRLTTTVVLGMGITYKNIIFFMVFKRKTGKRKSIWEITIKVKCMTSLKIRFNLILVYHLWIFLPYPYMTVPTPKKSCYASDILTATIYVASKNMLVIWPRLVTTHPLVFLLIRLLKRNISWWYMDMTVRNQKGANDLGAMTE